VTDRRFKRNREVSSHFRFTIMPLTIPSHFQPKRELSLSFDVAIKIPRTLQHCNDFAAYPYPAEAGSLTFARASDTGGTGRHGAGYDLVVSDGGALDSAPDQISIQTIGQVAAIEPVGPLPQVTREVFGADPVMGTDQPGFDVAEQRVDDRDWSQAKGRVERVHKTLQDRLVKELRLTGVRTLAEGNAVLPAFMSDYNARFARPPRTRGTCIGRYAPAII
jgi:hypothetical protein